MALIAPKVVIVRTMLGDVGNTFVGFVNRQQTVAQAGELGRRFEFTRADTILLAHPGQRAFAANLFEPQIRIVIL